MRTQSTARRLPRTLLALLPALVLSGCATARIERPSWPPPPEKARIRFIRTIQTEGDIETSFLRKVVRFLVPTGASTIIRQPMALALSPDDKRLYVANGVRGNVVEVNLETGTFTEAAAAQGHDAARPMGVAVDAEGNLFVADAVAGKILVFDAKRSFLREFGEGKLDTPTALALDRAGQVLYVLNGVSGKSDRHRVDVFSLRGEHLRTLGKRGVAPGEFNFPSGLGVGPDRQLYVVDMLNFRVQVFDPDGRAVAAFGQLGAGIPGTFNKARGIAFDTFGNLYVTDAEQGHVQLFNSMYQPLMVFGGRFAAPGFLAVPGAIAIDRRNHIFVGDSYTGKVSEYELFDTTAEESTAPIVPSGEPAGANPAK